MYQQLVAVCLPAPWCEAVRLLSRYRIRLVADIVPDRDLQATLQSLTQPSVSHHPPRQLSASLDFRSQHPTTFHHIVRPETFAQRLGPIQSVIERGALVRQLMADSRPHPDSISQMCATVLSLWLASRIFITHLRRCLWVRTKSRRAVRTATTAGGSRSRSRDCLSIPYSQCSFRNPSTWSDSLLLWLVRLLLYHFWQ